MLITVRSVALALILAVGPIGPTLCEFSCADASALHAMAGMSSGARHDMDDVSSAASHDMANVSTGHEDPAEGPGNHVTAAGRSACSHSGSVEPSILRAVDSASSLIAAAAEPPSALRTDFRAITFEVFTPLSASPPSHSPLLVQLRI